MLYVKNVSVTRYDDSGKSRKLFSGLDFSLNDGQLAVVLGDSGSGKTTLLDCIAGFIRPSTISSNKILKSYTEFIGNIFIDEQDVTLLEPRHREVGMVMQKFTLYPHMSVKGNLEFPLKMRKVPKELREIKILEVAKKLKIEDEIHKRVETISGGQAQRVAIGKLILREPKVALFDEAFSNLDAPLRKELRNNVINDFLKKDKNCVIFVSHEVKDAMMANIIIVFISPEKSQSGNGTKHEIFTGNSPGEAWEAMRKSNVIEINEYVNTI